MEKIEIGEFELPVSKKKVKLYEPIVADSLYASKAAKDDTMKMSVLILCRCSLIDGEKIKYDDFLQFPLRDLTFMAEKMFPEQSFFRGQANNNMDDERDELEPY